MRLSTLLVILALFPSVAGIGKVFHVVLTETDDKVLMDVNVIYGERYVPSKIEGRSVYTLVVIDDNGNVISREEFSMVSRITNIANVTKSTIVQIPYSLHAKKMELFRNGVLLVEYDLSQFCNLNGKCEKTESYLSCPQDCPSGSKDGYCDGVKDGICDPDCSVNYGDPDCISLVACGNKKCEAGESYLSCPQDCPSGSKDGYCDGVKDGICDPDCSKNEDVDCIKGFPKFPALIVMVAVSVLLYILYRKTKVY